MGHPLRIFYAAGPGDVMGTFRHWRDGHDDPTQVAMTYSGQFYDVVRELGAVTYVLGSNPNRGSVRDGNFRVEHRPTPFQHSGSGLLYHFGQTWSSLRLLVRAWWFKADVMVIVCGSGHWFPFRLARMLGIKIVPTMHCVIWKKGHRPSRVHRVVNALAKKFFRKTVSGVMTASHDISEQLGQLTDGRHKPIYEFLPSYRPEQFAGMPAPSADRNPFKVFYAGRIERNKGVFDLLEIAKRYDRDGRQQIEFDLCGSGGALDELRAEVAKSAPGVRARFRCHGHCNKPTMRQMFAAAHTVVVPTTSEFIEGFNQVVAEGVLSGRPVITSNVCPALDYVRDAVVEVPPDDVDAYAAAILKLCDDRAFYDAKTAACIAAQGQFYDPARGWAATLKAAFRAAGLMPDAAQRPVGATEPAPALS
ncbi:MAG TPA: glycosyltransferase family 4 protein [Tepidisphaeraceae bacterium]|nr:glycosyltransferase family 4 protein [Tepidisphaeraceae bacterium]